MLSVDGVKALTPTTSGKWNRYAQIIECQELAKMVPHFRLSRTEAGPSWSRIDKGAGLVYPTAPLPF